MFHNKVRHPISCHGQNAVIPDKTRPFMQKVIKSTINIPVISIFTPNSELDNQIFWSKNSIATRGVNELS